MAKLNIDKYLPQIKQDILNIIGKKYERILNKRIPSLNVYQSFSQSTITDLENSKLKSKNKIITSYQNLCKNTFVSENLPAATYTTIEEGNTQSVIFISTNQPHSDHMLIHEIIHVLG